MSDPTDIENAGDNDLPEEPLLQKTLDHLKEEKQNAEQFLVNIESEINQLTQKIEDIKNGTSI